MTAWVERPYGVGHGQPVHNDNTDIVEIYDSHVDEIYGYCLRRLCSRDLAEETASEVFARLVEKHAALKQQGKTRADIRNWLYGTASNHIARLILHAKRGRKLAEELARRQGDSVSAPEQEPLDWPVLYLAIGKLGVADQAIVTLRYGQGLTMAAIASALDMKPVTVRVRLTRAIRKLRELLLVPFGE